MCGKERKKKKQAKTSSKAIVAIPGRGELRSCLPLHDMMLKRKGGGRVKKKCSLVIEWGV
jgi:hypothetical protein